MRELHGHVGEIFAGRLRLNDIKAIILAGRAGGRGEKKHRHHGRQQRARGKAEKSHGLVLFACHAQVAASPESVRCIAWERLIGSRCLATWLPTSTLWPMSATRRSNEAR